MVKINSILARNIVSPFSNAKYSKQSIKSFITAGSAAVVVTAPVVLAQYKSGETKKNNPAENITYSKPEEVNSAEEKDIEKMFISMKFSKKFDKHEFELWAIDNNLKISFYNAGSVIEFKDKEGKIVREIMADYNDETLIRMEFRYLYDEDGNKRAVIIKEKGRPVQCEYDFGFKKHTYIVNNVSYDRTSDSPRKAILINNIWYDNFHKKLSKNPITGEAQ